MVRTLAVVGAKGFLGTAVVNLAARTGWRVQEFTRSAPAIRDGRLHQTAPEWDAVAWCAGEMNPHMVHTSSAMQNLEPHVVAEFLRALRSARLAPTFVYASSGGTVYGAPEMPPFGEDTPTHPVNSYGHQKLQTEKLTLEIAERPRILRLSNLYGPRQPSTPGQGVIGHWLRAVAAGDDIVMFGDASSTRDYIYIEDAAEAVIAAAAVHEGGGGIFNVGSGGGTSLGELIDRVGSAIRPRVVNVQREAARQTDTKHSWLDIERARLVLNWSPKVDLAEGIRRSWHYYESRIATVPSPSLPSVSVHLPNPKE